MSQLRKVLDINDMHWMQLLALSCERLCNVIWAGVIKKAAFYYLPRPYALVSGIT